MQPGFLFIVGFTSLETLLDLKAPIQTFQF